MAGITRMTVGIIQSNRDIRCSAIIGDNGKWSGWVSLWKDGVPHIDPMLESALIYDSEKEAIEAMERVVSEVRGMPMAFPGLQSAVPV